MTSEEYKAAVDKVSFRPDFVPRTLALLEARRKEPVSMKKVSLKTVLVAAALVAALAVTASAAVLLLSPGEVAREAGRDTLAQAFEGENAVAIDQAETVGDYQVTLMGMLPGADLPEFGGSVDAAQTYVVLACARTDGEPITDAVPEVTATPLVEGYAPWMLNAWTLSGGATSFTQDGVLYYLFECDTLEPFADHEVYLAVYPGTHQPPNAETFSFGPDGAIAYQPGQEGVLFTLPLDPAKADPAKAAELASWDDTEDEPEPEELGETDESQEYHVVEEHTDGDGTSYALIGG